MYTCIEHPTIQTEHNSYDRDPHSYPAYLVILLLAIDSTAVYNTEAHSCPTPKSQASSMRLLTTLTNRQPSDCGMNQLAYWYDQKSLFLLFRSARAH